MSFLIPFILFGVWDINFHDGNNIRCWVSNFGEFGQKAGDRPGLEWPKGSGYYYLFGAGIWFGAILPDTCVSMGYNPNTGSGECVPGLCRQGTTAYQNPYVKIYIYPEIWPPPKDTFPMAPDTTLTFEDSWCCFNENDPKFHDPEDTHPIGVEFYQSVYADPGCSDAIFFRYRVKNCTTNLIPEGVIGIVADPIIPNCRAGYVFNRWFWVGGDSFYIDTLLYLYGDHPGMLGIYLLSTPEQKGPLGCMFIDTLDPTCDRERYLLMKGINFRTGDSIGFMPPAESVERFLLTTGTFALEPGEEEDFVFTLVFGEDTLELFHNVHKARLFYEQNLSVSERESGGMNRPVIATIASTSLEIGPASYYRIFDRCGREIGYGSEPKLDLSGFSPGIYFIMVDRHHRIDIMKLVIIR